MNEQQIWKPYPGMQTRFLQSTAFETLAGGSRGPGKTAVGVINALKPKWLTNPRVRGLVIRKNADDLADWLDRARFYYKRYGGEVTGKPGIVRFPSGYMIRTGHLKDENAYTKYQGQEYQWILIEELTQIPREIDYLKLIASCRSSISGIDPRVYATTNPGGVGHIWVKNRFIDPAPPNTKFIAEDTGRTRIFLPGTVDDNPALRENDPDYIKFLDGLKHTDIELYKAWRLGDWNTFAGQYFREWRPDLHVCPPFMPSKSSVIVGGLDWGRKDNFSFHLAEIQRVEYGGTHFFRSRVFLEVYGTEQNVVEWSNQIKDRMKNYNLTLDDIAWVRADTQIYSSNIDPKVLDIYTQFVQTDDRWRRLKPANKDRIGGWENLHRWFSLAPDGRPYCQIASTCVNAIRLIPALIHDDNKVEDVDQAGENDAADSVRYLHMSLKWIDAGTAGAVYQQEPSHVYLPQAPRFVKGKQVGINLDAWGNENDAGNNDSGPVIRE